MALLEQIQKEMATAMKAREEARLSALRMIKAALMKEKVDSMKPLDEAAELRILGQLAKQRRESVEMYEKAGRTEQAASEAAELKIIESYMPASASDEELQAALEAALTETGITAAKQMGQLMTAVKAKLAGKRVDGKLLSERVKARLS
jgi:uncharacterized protein YqeY